MQETGRVLLPLFAHESFNQISNHNSIDDLLSRNLEHTAAYSPLPPHTAKHFTDGVHYEIDKRCLSNSAGSFSDPAREVHFNALSYQMRGETVRQYGYYDQSLHDLTRAIQIDPTHPDPYLERSMTYFDMGEYEKSKRDFNDFAAHTQKHSTPFLFPEEEFTLGFAKAIPGGIDESGKGLVLFFGDCITHPVHTEKDICSAFSTLAQLAIDNQWGEIGKICAPEIHELVTKWNTLSPEKKGELAGHAFGKLGGDIFVPGTTAKIAGKGIKAGKEVATALKKLKKAEHTLLLETAAQVGNSAKVENMVDAARKTSAVGKELGFTSKEMGQLKKAGQLEKTITKTKENLSPAGQKSFTKFYNLEKEVTAYRKTKTPLSEAKIRGMLHKHDIHPPARPKGVPRHYKAEFAERGEGIKFVDPNNPHTYVRVMPGNPHGKNQGCPKQDWTLQSFAIQQCFFSNLPCLAFYLVQDALTL